MLDYSSHVCVITTRHGCFCAVFADLHAAQQWLKKAGARLLEKSSDTLWRYTCEYELALQVPIIKSV